MAQFTRKQTDFIVSVRYTEHGSWQGTVTWSGNGKKVPFRSALELLYLMDEAVEKKKREENEMEQ